MQSLEFNEFTKFTKTIAQTLVEIPSLKRSLFTMLSKEGEARVRTRIGGGRLASWQKAYVGTGGGYSKVQAITGYHTNGAAYGAITNYNESGHVKVVFGKRYEGERVAGRYFYRDTREEMQPIIKRETEKFVEDLVRKIEGNDA